MKKTAFKNGSHGAITWHHCSFIGALAAAEADAAVTKLDKYIDDICPQPSKWYHLFKRTIDENTGFLDDEMRLRAESAGWLDGLMGVAGSIRKITIGVDHSILPYLKHQ